MSLAAVRFVAADATAEPQERVASDASPRPRDLYRFGRGRALSVELATGCASFGQCLPFAAKNACFETDLLVVELAQLGQETATN